MLPLYSKRMVEFGMAGGHFVTYFELRGMKGAPCDSCIIFNIYINILTAIFQFFVEWVGAAKNIRKLYLNKKIDW
jgi:hypothetical protein